MQVFLWEVGRQRGSWLGFRVPDTTQARRAAAWASVHTSVAMSRLLGLFREHFYEITSESHLMYLVITFARNTQL